MKINMSMERYDIKSLDDIYKASVTFKDKCEELEYLGFVMKQRLDRANEEFETINYQRVEQAIVSYLKKMKNMREEVTELANSCHEFAEKIADIWS